MKKILFILVVFFICYVAFTNNKDYYVIPQESIRFRVIANSNGVNDLYIKEKVKTALEKSFLIDLNSSSNINESRNIINSNIPNYKKIISNILEEEQYNKDFNIKYGMNYFPEKEYKGVIYEEGNYESLVITLGEGNGNNFWCVLFPPICSLEVEEDKNISYHLLIKDLFDKYILNK